MHEPSYSFLRVPTNRGVLHLQRGRPDEARAHLTAGEHRLREPSDPVRLANLRILARLEAQAGDAERGARSEATDLAASPDSGLGRALAAAHATVETP